MDKNLENQYKRVWYILNKGVSLRHIAITMPKFQRKLKYVLLDYYVFYLCTHSRNVYHDFIVKLL